MGIILLVIVFFLGVVVGHKETIRQVKTKDNKEIYIIRKLKNEDQDNN